MRKLLDFLISKRHWFIFLVLEIVSFVMIYRNNSYQRSIMFSSANVVTGYVSSISASVNSYLNLRAMSGYFLLFGICVVVFFVIVMKLAGVMVGATMLSELIVSSIIYIITMFLVVLTRKDWRTVEYMLIGAAVAYLGGFITSRFMPFDFS